MTTLIIGIAWIAASVLVGWLAGRFIRVGMVELQNSEDRTKKEREEALGRIRGIYRSAEEKETPP